MPQINATQHLAHKGEKHKSIAEKSKLDIVNLLYAQSTRVAIGHVICAAFIAAWFYAAASGKALTIWVLSIVAYSCARLFLKSLFIRYHNPNNTHLWIRAWVLLSSSLACVYSLGFICVTPLEQSEYIVAAGMAVTALTAASAIGYGASRVATLGFFVPCVVPIIIYFGIYGGKTGFMMAMYLAFYSMVVLAMLKPMNAAFKKSIVLNYQREIEIEKRKLIERQLKEISRRDGLTGLFNRRYFDERLEAEIGRAHRNHTPLCLLMFDIDFFKEYNDEYGHVAGDNSLITVANLVEELTSRQGDLVARYGGEEFAIILPNIDLHGAVAFADKLQLHIQDSQLPHKASKLDAFKYITVSIGVTNLMPFTKVPASQLIETADKALYKAKQAGRNCVHYIENCGMSQTQS